MIKYVLYFITSIAICSTALGMQPSESAAQAAAAAQPMMTLQLVDGSVRTPRAQLDGSQTLHDLLGDIPTTESTPIPLAAHISVTTNDWKNVIQPALEKIQQNKSLNIQLDPITLDQIIKKIETNNVQKTIQSYARIIEGADYLEIKPLVASAIENVADYMKNSYETFLTNPEYFAALQTLSAHLQQRISMHIFAVPIFHKSGDATIMSVALNTAGTTLAYGAVLDGIKIWDLSQPHNPYLRTTLDKTNGGHPDLVQTLAMRTTLASGSTDNTIKLWNSSGPYNQPLATLDTRRGGHTEEVNVLVMNAESSLLVSASEDKTIKLWNISQPHNPQLLAALSPRNGGHIYKVKALAMNAAGTLLASGSMDETIKLWNISQPHNPQFLATLNQPNGGHIQAINALAMNAAGTLLASGSDDKTIKLWNISQPRNPQFLATIDQTKGGHTDWVNALGMNAEGTILVSGSSDTTIKLWDIFQPDNPQLRATIKTPYSVTALAINQEGSKFAAASGYDVSVWDLSISTLEASLLFYSLQQQHRDTGKKFTLENVILQQIYAQLNDNQKKNLRKFVSTPAVTTQPEPTATSAREEDPAEPIARRLRKQ